MGLRIIGYNHGWNERVVAQLAEADLGKGFLAIFGVKGSLKAFYLLMNHSQTSHENFFNCFRSNLALQAGQTYYAVQDSTKADFTSQHEKEGMDYVSGLYQRGIWLHNNLLLSAGGLPEGILCQQVIIRDDKDYGKKQLRRQRPFEEKESYKWVKALICAEAVATQYGCRFIHIMDREADVLNVIKTAWKHNKHFIFRSCQDRRLAREDVGVKGLPSIWSKLSR